MAKTGIQLSLMAHLEMQEVEMFQAATARILTYIKNETPAVFLIAAALTSFPAIAANAQLSNPDKLAEIVAHLGESGDLKRIEGDITGLASSPKQSVEMLIQQIHVLPSDADAEKQDNLAMEHVLWSFRALRYLTGGKEFCSTTAHNFSSSEEEQNRAYWLKFKHGSCLTFFCNVAIKRANLSCARRCPIAHYRPMA
jgi:hypothetical protein